MNDRSKEVDEMNAVSERSCFGYLGLDVEDLLAKTDYSVVSTEKGLCDIVPIDWEDEVVHGDKKVVIYGVIDDSKKSK